MLALRSAPIIMRSLACSRAAMVTLGAPSRAARSAARFTRLARSAPLKPGVPRAITYRASAAFDVDASSLEVPSEWISNALPCPQRWYAICVQGN